MSTPDLPGQSRVPRGTPAQLLETLRRAATGRVSALLQHVQAAAEAELRARLAADERARDVEDSLTQLSILRRDTTMYERRWQEQIGRAFEGWPKPAAIAATASYALLSDTELQSQLVGQPVIEALDRRFVDILDVIDSRLWSFAATLGGQQRPLNPVGPRVMVESFLATFPANECERELRLGMLRHFERAVADEFGEFYGWFNQQLSEAGFAMTRATDYAMLMASTLGGIASPTENSIDGSFDNAVTESNASWRNRGNSPQRAQNIDAVRGNLLRKHVRELRPQAGDAAAVRELRSEEFLTLLSLLQGEDNGLGAVDARPGGVAARLRTLLEQAAARLGMERATMRFNGEQEDAIDAIGLLFDGLLADHALSPNAQALLLSLAYPYLRLTLGDPSLFEPPEHPALALLSSLVQLLDGNHGDEDHVADLLTLAARGVGQLVDEYHGEAHVFDRVRAALHDELEPREKRAEIAQRRASQSILGRERLHAARGAADRMLAQRIERQPLLASVVEFLSDTWRQSLIHAWLREGEDSQRFRATLALADAMIAIDRNAAQAQGHAVAEGLIALQQPLRDCYIACGLGEGGADEMLAALVAELSRPDAKRAVRGFTPFASDQEDDFAVAADATAATSPLAIGQWVLWRAPGQPHQLLRLAWISPHSARHLLVNRQGMRQLLLTPAALGEYLALGALLPRSPSGPVEGVLERLMAESTAGA